MTLGYCSVTTCTERAYHFTTVQAIDRKTGKCIEAEIPVCGNHREVY